MLKSVPFFYTRSLDIAEDKQSKGLGRYLIEAVLWEMRKIGYQNATLATNEKNYRAQLLYTNLGYHVIDTSHVFVKDINSLP